MEYFGVEQPIKESRQIADNIEYMVFFMTVIL